MCDEVKKVVDAALHAKSVQLDCEEAFWTPISKGIHSDALYDLREADINDILDADINRVRFRKGWEKWKQSLEEEQFAQSASGRTSTSGKLGDGDTLIIQQRALPWTIVFQSTKSMQRLSEENEETFQSDKRNYIILRKLPPRVITVVLGFIISTTILDVIRKRHDTKEQQPLQRLPIYPKFQ
uniref:Uncharacterized protein n=1 Tax=Phlebotomus papatasi TaxID=29031 RepID=A0A1B0CZB3_PHLPP